MLDWRNCCEISLNPATLLIDKEVFTLQFVASRDHWLARLLLVGNGADRC
jgi:hypothetical protein